MKHAFVLACASLLALSACLHDPSLNDVQRLAGLAPPAETPEDQFERAPGILARADSLIVSTVYAETDSPAIPPHRILTQCSGPQCTLTHQLTGQSLDMRPSDIELVNDGTQALGTKHGVTLTAMATEHMGSDVTTFGAWMEHSGFSVETLILMSEGVTLDSRNGIAGGTLTDTRPTGGATWLGLMVGRPATGENRHDRLLGDAALNYDFDVGVLDVGFSSIVNIDRGAAHSTSTVIFTDLQIAPDGTFARGEAGYRIQGGLYGPEHAEAAGVFEQSNIVGAFGARRQ